MPDTVKLVGAVTVTVAFCGALLPPAPVQVIVKVVVAVSAAEVCVPVVAFAPAQPAAPLVAVHDVALVDDQVSKVVPPEATDVGLADSVAVAAGGGATDTVAVALWAVVPPMPVQLRVKVVLVVSAGEVSVPEVAFAPVHPFEAVHEVALVDDHVIAVVLPLVTEVGLTLIDTVGAGTTVTVALCVTLLPPAFAQVSE
ncbi:MAG: hypothetical protein IT483_04210 [Gammaproteobacteria bacterium]|nr:hypothetical protein [Gammaproteobacteria bacterium]